MTTPAFLPPPVTILNVGNSGGGKTGALLALARKGFRIRIADFDNAARQVLFGITHGPTGQRKPEYHGVLERFDIVTFADRLKRVGDRVKSVNTVSAWERFLGALDKWPPADGGASPEGVLDWGPDTIFVLDTLTHAGNASLRYILKLNKREGENPTQANWGDAMRGLEDVLAMLTFGDRKCHVIVNAHLLYQEADGEGGVEGLPMALGTKLPPKISSYFPVMVRTKSVRNGQRSERAILTTGDTKIELKVPAPDLPQTLPQVDGLATIFARLGWPAPPAASI